MKWLKWFFDSNVRAAIVGAIVGAILGLVLPLLYALFVGHPTASTMTDIMNREALGAKLHDVTVVSRIYAPDAVVTDAGCQSPGASTIWSGRVQIEARYNALPAF